jgi:hypothetical protein
MKTALLLSGNPRFSVDFDSQLENLQNSNVDVFIVFWRRPDGTDPKISPNWCNLHDGDEVIQRLQPNIPDRYRICHAEVLDPRTFGDPPADYQPYNSTPYNVWQQYNILKYCDQIRQKFDNYDLVIRSRSDLGLNQVIDLPLAHQTLQVYPKCIFTPKNQRYGYQIDFNGFKTGFNDQFAIGLPEVIKLYTEAVDHFDNLYRQGIAYNPEFLVQTHLYRNGVSWPETTWEIIRDPAHYVPIEHGRWVNV